MADALLTDVGAKIRAIRKEKNLSIEEVANSINAGSNYLSQVERGQRNPTIKMLSKIALALGVLPESLLPNRRKINIKNNYIELVIKMLSQLKPEKRKAVLQILKETVTQIGKL